MRFITLSDCIWWLPITLLNFLLCNLLLIWLFLNHYLLISNLLLLLIVKVALSTIFSLLHLYLLLHHEFSLLLWWVNILHGTTFSGDVIVQSYVLR